jgi:16S rRNA (cytosine1402-N4)-methyltransferase
METETPSVRADAHRPVMVVEALAALEPRQGGVYCDATLGAGGHAEEILRRSAPDGRLFGIDRDAAILARTAARLSCFGDRFVPIHGRFSEAVELLAAHGLLPHTLDGLLADLGVSSMQLDTPERGFSFQHAGPIDMRMDQTQGETALELIERLSAETLSDILREYGEERHARRIAAALKRAAAAGELDGTLALARAVLSASPRHESHKHPATRTFQALRIAVNDELRQLHGLLSSAPRLLAPGGRLVIISFHSLEDRLVKRHLLRGGLVPSPRRPQVASAAELAGNPRARSARLRAASLIAAVADCDVEEARPC